RGPVGERDRELLFFVGRRVQLTRERGRDRGEIGQGRGLRSGRGEDASLDLAAIELAGGDLRHARATPRRRQGDRARITGLPTLTLPRFAKLRLATHLVWARFG